MTVGRRIEVRGIVQGVGFRPWVYRLAVAGGVAGRVRNEASGVIIEAFGSQGALDQFAARLRSTRPPAAEIREMRLSEIPVEALDAFSILPSVPAAQRLVSIPPDLATCPDCLADVGDPMNRRFNYAFTNCTNCGPRFTIARDVPYDRATTTMAAFGMCPACQREYENVSDRRFHAQPNACPVCGPTLLLRTSRGEVLATDDPIAAAAVALAEGAVLAIKGLGGFHLACDATSRDVVDRLRQRKRRDEKPFAVMVRDLVDANALATLTPQERRLLTSVERPIVLSLRRAGCALAPNVAPNNPLVGLLLPYTPLHHLLLNRVQRPIVMTSGNVSEEPLAFRNDEAVDRLAPLADLFLLHDRGIETPCDDSVARIIRHQPVVLRRARGFVPRSIAVSPGFDMPVLACGALLKNTFCLGVGEAAYLGPHVGDLSNLAAYDAYVESIARMERFLRVAPAIVAHDLHPDYLSTRYALTRSDATTIGVQHHHAHVASAMAEHGLQGPVIGVAYDGTGYGVDGTSWGGEVMFARRDRFERVATLRPIRLAGADQAIRQPWRIALALVEDAFDGELQLDDLPLFSAVASQHLEQVRHLLRSGAPAPLAHGAGRYFDGIGSLTLARPQSHYEGHIALEWNVIADPCEDQRYGFTIDRTVTPWTIDLRPMVRGVVRDLRAGVAPSIISARFHNTLTAATTTAVRTAADLYGRLPVVLTGGCFQNPRLAESVATDLASHFAVHLHHQVPPGDGGVALGQAVVAAAIARRM